MRMDPTAGQTAADLVNTLPVEELATLFRQNGEGRLSGRIARAVVQARPLTSTRQLAEVVASAVPAPARRKGHPARRVFQALRIEVNDELGQLAAVLPVALSHLQIGGRVRGDQLPLGGGPADQAGLRRGRIGRLCLPAGTALRLRRHGPNISWCSVAPARRRRLRSLPIRVRRAPGLRAIVRTEAHAA